MVKDKKHKIPLYLNYKAESWFQYLDHAMKDLVSQSFVLLESELAYKKERFHDYSFIVFPVAKAYEGFLKKFMLDLQLINQETFESRYFRIGRSLNPDLPIKYRDGQWLYDDMVQVCSAEIVSEMWRAWIEARNSLFHYFFPDHENFVRLQIAQQKVEMVVAVMKASVECGVIDL